MIRMAIIWWLLFFVLVALPLTLVLAGLTPMWALGLSLVIFFILQLALPCGALPVRGRYRSRRAPIVVVSAGRLVSPNWGLYGSFGGAIGGASLRRLHQAWLAKAWVSFGAILACAILVFFVVTEVWTRKLRQ